MRALIIAAAGQYRAGPGLPPAADREPPGDPAVSAAIERGDYAEVQRLLSAEWEAELAELLREQGCR